ncbi:MAG: hypothetical protein WA102_07605 [Candidatus Methanoperedens sp.]
MARAIAYIPEEKHIINILYIAHKPLTTSNIREGRNGMANCEEIFGAGAKKRYC